MTFDVSTAAIAAFVAGGIGTVIAGLFSRAMKALDGKLDKHDAQLEEQGKSIARLREKIIRLEERANVHTEHTGEMKAP